MMNKIVLAFCIVFLSSCSSYLGNNHIGIETGTVSKIEVYQGFPGVEVEMEDDFESDFIRDLNQAKDVGPMKFGKTNRVLIYHHSGSIDTLLTNGSLYQFDGWYEASENLIDKYRK